MQANRTLLIIDDSVLVRETLRNIFKGLYHIVEAETGHQALEIVSRGGIFAILLDLFLPDMDGFTVLRRIQADEKNSIIPVIMITSSEASADEVYALKMGASDFVNKPFVPEVLLHRVNNAVEKRTLQESMSAQVMRELTRRANYDPLTGIYNKEAFYRVTREMLDRSPETNFVLVRWNVERFKLINDLFGKEKGDQVLRKIAEALAEDVPDGGTYGRLEADHFVACLPADMLEVEELLNRSVYSFGDLDIDHAIIVDTGLYEIDEPGLPIDQMCDRANLALQTINGNYNRHYAYYNDDMRTAMLQEQTIRGEMSEALEKRQFEVYLQPICSLSTGRAISAEALVRWIHPTRGVIGPSDFIPLFERSGFITELDRYVWEEVCRYLQVRREKGLPSLPISVNASRTSLYKANFHEEIVALTHKYGVNPALFKIEITETAYADNPGQLLETTVRLQQAGYAILMDDFGSGYSSLNTLKDIPVDTLKIDMKFLEGFESGGRVGTVLLSVLRMAKWLDVSVVAEGVETTDQMAFLRSAGCDWIQGYCFAKPMPFDEFEAYVAGLHPIREEREEVPFAYQDFDQLMGGNQLINRLMNGMFGGFALYEYSDRKMEIIRVNDGYYSILGYTPATLQKQTDPVHAQMHPDDEELFWRACEETIRTGEAVRITLRRRHYDGRMLVLECIFRQMGGNENNALLCVAFNDITDRLAAEKKAREGQERYQLISEISGTIVLEWDLRTGRFHSDENFAQYTISDYEGPAVHGSDQRLAQVHPDDWLAFEEHEQTDHTTDYKMVEVRLLVRDGSWHWCRLTRNCVRDENGTVIRILGTLNDINEQRRSEQALVAKEAQLRSVEANMAGAIGVFQVEDERLRLRTFSEGLCRITGYTKAEAEVIFTQPGSPGVHPDDRAGLAAEMRRCIRQESVFAHSYRLSCKDGTFSWINLTASPMRLDGELKYYGVFTDIEEQHNTSAQLEIILSNVDAGITMYQEGTDGCRIYANDRFYQILGVNKETFGKQGSDFFDRVLPEYREEARQSTDRLMREGKIAPMEYPIQRGDGTVCWLNLRMSLMSPLGSPRPVMLTVLTDITERRESSRRNELHRYSKALFGVYNEIFEINYTNATITSLATRHPQSSPQAHPWEETRDHWVNDIVAPEYREQIRALLVQPTHEDRERARHADYQVLVNGERLWLSTTIIHLEAEDYLVCNLDVTQRKETERLLSENLSLRTKQQEQERYRIIVEQTGALVLEWDLSTGSFYASKGYEQLEISQEEPFGLLSAQGELRIPSLDGEDLMRSISKEMQLRRMDGSVGWYRVTHTGVRGSTGRITRVVGTVADIDSQKTAQLGLESALARLQTLIDTIPTGISGYEADREAGTLIPVFYSAGRARTLGYTQEDMMQHFGNNAYLLVHPDDRVRVQAMFQETIRNGLSLDCTYRQMAKDGQSQWVRVNCGAVPSAGKKTTLYCVYTDMEALIKSQRELVYRDQMAQLLLADSDTVTMDYQLAQDLLTVNFLDRDGTRTTERLFQYVQTTKREGHIHPSDRAAFREMLSRVLLTGKEEVLSLRGTYGGKGLRWYRCSMEAIFDEHKQVSRVIGKCRDITEKRKAENRYREELDFNKSLGRELLSSLRVNLTRQIAEEGGGLMYREPPVIGGHMDDEVMWDYCAACISDADDRKKYFETFRPDALLAAYERGADTAQLDYRLNMHDGRRRWVHTRVKLVKKPDSGEVVALYNTWDIHEKKIAQSLVDSVVELDYDFLMYLDPADGTYALYPNAKRSTRALTENTGDYEQQRGRDMLGFIHPADQERWLQQSSLDYIRAELEKQPRIQVDYRLLEKDGRIAYKRTICTWLDEEKSAILATRVDVTEQVRQEQARSEAMRQALSTAEQASAEKSRFLSRTSHEIRTPMNAIIGMSGLALGERSSPEPVKAYLRKIQYAGEYMLALVNDILDISRIESGQVELHPVPYAVEDYVEQLETLVSPSMEEKNIAFALDFDTVKDCVLWMDKARVLQIVTNLLHNAVKFTPEGGHVSCRLDCIPGEGDSVTLRTVVEDSGEGMSAHFMERMFEPFEQENYGQSGSGLGLALVHRLVDAMHGKISVTSEKQRGTAFTVYLPLRCGEQGQQQDASGLSVLTDDFTFADRRVLVVEDQGINAEVARKLLEKKLFTVDVVTDGAQAVERFLSQEVGWYSAILMDILMPVMDGLEATRRIRAANRPDARSVPIIAMTGNAFDDDVRRSLAAGMDAHLEKPVQPRQLYQTMAALIFARENNSKLRESDHRVRQQEKIYRLLLSRSNSRIFEYVVETDELTISGLSGARNQTTVIEQFVEKLMQEDMVEPPYRERLRSILRQNGQAGDEEILFRANFNDEGYRWHSAIYKFILDGDGQVVRIVGRVDDVDEKTKRTLALQEKAEYDAVTSLYNRATFEELVRNDLATRDEELDGLAAFVEFDLDNFKNVNDTYGHLVGDELLRSVAMAARVCLRREDLLGRMGGDEFVIWMNDVGSVDNVVKKMREFRQTIRESSLRLGLNVEVTASFGVAMAEAGLRDFNQLFHRADLAMYQAKRHGKNDCVVYLDEESEEK